MDSHYESSVHDFDISSADKIEGLTKGKGLDTEGAV
jgi:hypothetical protein